MLPIIAIAAGHDASIAVYDPVTNEVKTIVMDRFSDIKHFVLMDRPSNEAIAMEVVNWFEEVAHYLSSKLGYDRFSIGCIKSNFFFESLAHQSIELMASVFDVEHWVRPPSHHAAHAYSAFWQSPFSHADILTHDGAGDNKSTTFSTMTDGEIKNFQDITSWRGDMFTIAGWVIRQIKRSGHDLDHPGKVMGLSAYGQVDSDAYKYFQRVCLKSKRKKDYTLRRTGGKLKLIEDEAIAASVQQAISDLTIEQMPPKNSSNLVIGGGVALNVLINERIRQECGYDNVYVPPNPDDSGLSHGILYYLLTKHDVIKFDDKHDILNSGMPVFDPKFKHQRQGVEKYKTSIDEIATCLRNGNIIGLIDGPGEIGPRALGRRSIICDPSLPGMKDKINTVKRREYYRPFAPVCTQEQYSHYFQSHSEYGHQLMSYTSTVREEAKHWVAAATHIDNTARVQVVDDGRILHQLVSEIGRPLLNTSFNIAGKPIVNKLKHAVQFLNTSALDFVVYNDGEDLWKFVPVA